MTPAELTAASKLFKATIAFIRFSTTPYEVYGVETSEAQFEPVIFSDELDVVPHVLIRIASLTEPDMGTWAPNKALDVTFAQGNP